MKEILDHTKEYIQLASKGDNLSGHGYFSSFPNKHKDMLGKELDVLFYAINFVFLYCDKPLQNRHFEFLDKVVNLETPPFVLGRDKYVIWNLYNALLLIQKKLKTKNNEH